MIYIDLCESLIIKTCEILLPGLNYSNYEMHSAITAAAGLLTVENKERDIHGLLLLSACQNQTEQTKGGGPLSHLCTRVRCTTIEYEVKTAN